MLINLLYGIISGFLISFGMGGGSFLIYILSKNANITQQEIQYIQLWIYVFCSAISIFSYAKNKKINWKTFISLLPSAIISCIFFSLLSKNMNSNVLKKYFGIFLIIIGIVQVFFQIYIKYYKQEEIENE